MCCHIASVPAVLNKAAIFFCAESTKLSSYMWTRIQAALTCASLLLAASFTPVISIRRDPAKTTAYTSQLLPGVPTNMRYELTSYGPVLAYNKARLVSAFDTCITPPAQRRLFMAMAMLETNTLTDAERDASKDDTTDGSANVSLFNLNVDMIRRLNDDPDRLDDGNARSLALTVCLLQKGIKDWGVIGLLNFVRGGFTGFASGNSTAASNVYGIKDYRKTVASIMSAIDKRPVLMRDDRRVEIFLEHV